MAGPEPKPVTLCGLQVDLTLLGIFIALLPAGAYFGILVHIGPWNGVLGIGIAYLLIVLRHPHVLGRANE